MRSWICQDRETRAADRLRFEHGAAQAGADPLSGLGPVDIQRMSVSCDECQQALALSDDLDRDVLQFLRLDDVAVEAGFLERAAVGDAQELAVVDHRHVELGALLPVDLGLVHLDIRLAQRAGRADHVSAVGVGYLGLFADAGSVPLGIG